MKNERDFPSIRTYIEALDLDELHRLVELGQERIKVKKEASWTKYWEVSDDILVEGRYPFDDWAAAQRRAIEIIQKAKPGDWVKVEIRVCKCPPDEAAETITGDL
jgi:hypothetical protein